MGTVSYPDYGQRGQIMGIINYAFNWPFLLIAYSDIE